MPWQEYGVVAGSKWWAPDNHEQRAQDFFLGPFCHNHLWQLTTSEFPCYVFELRQMQKIELFENSKENICNEDEPG